MLGADWNDLDLFFHVATQGGLTAAAIATGVSAPTIGRRMLGLERQLGRTLFVRSPQGYRLAHDGTVLLDHVRVMRRAADSIIDWQRDAFALPIVSIAGDAWIAGFLADHAQAIRGGDDAFRICCKSAHTGLDLTFREADVAILAARPEHGNFAVRPSVTMRYGVYGAVAMTVEAAERWISLGTESAASSADRWVFEHHENRIMTWTSSPDLLLRLIRKGQGLGVLPLFVGDADPGLARRGEPIMELDHPLLIVANDDDRKRPEVRIALDRIAGLLKAYRGAFCGESAAEARQAAGTGL
ncbi:DNA-binding transcriptional LysR family regulator [Rhizobium sp. SG_E_25_P2]|uniref:LysR family transcriptional regulator n=1 Tax=Rhizobium sp. SG_E_25_P2 TaxID=2879942 RepID=UPI002475B22E|nr:LysR family transcriptional regulator [Rhizobium sp. SG_E_25_P2]MDH6267174.1 DNA-binding transcriptional LysR family regulator [Rhizobium sp. SG_E_25_P2]